MFELTHHEIAMTAGGTTVNRGGGSSYWYNVTVDGQGEQPVTALPYPLPPQPPLYSDADPASPASVPATLAAASPI